MNDSTKPSKKNFEKPVLTKYGSIEQVTLKSQTTTSTNVSCATGGGCSTMVAATAIPEFCSYC